MQKDHYSHHFQRVSNTAIWLWMITKRSHDRKLFVWNSMLVARNLICVSSLFQSLHFSSLLPPICCIPLLSSILKCFWKPPKLLSPSITSTFSPNTVLQYIGCFGGCVTQHRITKKTNNANKYLKSTFKILLPIQFLFSLFSPELALFHTSMLGCRIPEGWRYVRLKNPFVQSKQGTFNMWVGVYALAC